jgi:hypothetical protein
MAHASLSAWMTCLGKLHLSVFALLSAGLIGCGSEPALKVPVSRLDAVIPDTSGSASLNHYRATIAQRKSDGDTALISAERLLGVLTDTITGYKLDISLADTLETPLATLIEAKRVFYNGDEAFVELIAGDYVRDPGLMEINLLRYNLAQGVEVEGVTDLKRTASGLTPPGVPNSFCWSSFNKVQRIARIYIGVDYRYFFTIEATMQDAQLDLGKVAGWLNWKSMYKR